MAYSDKQIIFIKKLKDAGEDWATIADAYNTEFGDNKTANAIRKTHKRFEDADLSDSTLIKNLESARRVSQENRKLKKEKNAILDNQISYREILDEFEKLIKSGKLSKIKVKAPKKTKGKKKMIIEPLIGDLHYHLKTPTYNVDILREKMRHLAQVTIDETTRYSKLYNIEGFNILMLGDLIQSATMHKDSHMSCDGTNAQQVTAAIESLFFDYLLPIAKLGYKTKVIGIGGNHDRTAMDRPTVEPGHTYLTYIIYNTLDMLCKQTGLKNVVFDIPVDAYRVYEIFGSYFLVEHGDLCSKNTMAALETQINKRSVQEGKLIKGIRIGHYHNDVVGNVGRYMVNGSTVSDDHYGNSLGYKSRPCQIINYYVETKRDTPYYHSLVVNLE